MSFGREGWKPGTRMEKYDYAVELYRMGYSIRVIAMVFDVTPAAMFGALKIRIPLRNKSEAPRGAMHRVDKVVGECRAMYQQLLDNKKES